MPNERIGQIAIAAVILIGLFFAREFLGGTANDETASEPAPTTSISGSTTIADSPKIGGDAPAAEEPAAQPTGKFDYYVLTLSWSPTHCASEQGADDEMQCLSGRPYGFVLHGLWPQHERGYPEFCLSGEPKRMNDALMRKMLEVSPSEELVQHEWQKHGTCAGLSQADYAAAAIKAFKSISIPAEYRQPAGELNVNGAEVRSAFVAANRHLSLSDDEMTPICRGRDLSEVWVCLDKDLSPRACAADVSNRACTRRSVRMRAVRGDWSR
jgi:ribonuclease T2